MLTVHVKYKNEKPEWHRTNNETDIDKAVFEAMKAFYRDGEDLEYYIVQDTKSDCIIEAFFKNPSLKICEFIQYEVLS